LIIRWQINAKKTPPIKTFSLRHFQNLIIICFSDTLRNADVKKGSVPDPELGLYLDAYLTCDGFTYNVSRTLGPPTPGKTCHKYSENKSWQFAHGVANEHLSLLCIVLL
jgi:hypothetical protein